GKMDKDYLVLKRASTSRSSGEWSDDDYDVLADGRIFKVHSAPVGTPWMWTLAFGHHEDRWPTHGYEPTREAAMATFAKSWAREVVVEADESGGSNRTARLHARGVLSFPTHLAREGRMTVTIGRRELLAALGGAAATWPLARPAD